MLPVRTFFGRDFDQLFDRMADTVTPTVERVWRPRLDAYRSDEGFVIDIDLPGVDPDVVDVTVEDGVLTVSGSRDLVRTEEGFLHERITGSFTRRLTIPEGIEAEQIRATYVDGVLSLVLPAPVEPEPKVTRVAIERS